MSESAQANLITQLLELIDAFTAHQLPLAAIGGIAVNIHGYNRATHDLDFLVSQDDEPRARALMHTLGYTEIDHREDLSSYVRGTQRVDFLHARRPISRKLLAQASTVNFANVRLSVVSVEGVIGLKIQAFTEDPRRLKDLLDTVQLMKIRASTLNMAELREYFRLFNREDLLNDLLRPNNTPST